MGGEKITILGGFLSCKSVFFSLKSFLEAGLGFTRFTEQFKLKNEIKDPNSILKFHQWKITFSLK